MLCPFGEIQGQEMHAYGLYKLLYFLLAATSGKHSFLSHVSSVWLRGSRCWLIRESTALIQTQISQTADLECGSLLEQP